MRHYETSIFCLQLRKRNWRNMYVRQTALIPRKQDAWVAL